MSSSTWVPLLVAGVGVAGTLIAGIGGVLITQRWSDRRESAARAREREREHERWAREDEARTFEHRREAYMDFYVAVKAMGTRAFERIWGFSDELRLPEGWDSEAQDKLGRLQLYADRPVASAASAAFSAAWSWGMFGESRDPAENEGEPDEHAERYHAAERQLFVLIRKSLSIPDVDPTCRPRMSPTSCRRTVTASNDRQRPRRRKFASRGSDASMSRSPQQLAGCSSGCSSSSCTRVRRRTHPLPDLRSGLLRTEANVAQSSF